MHDQTNNDLTGDRMRGFAETVKAFAEAGFEVTPEVLADIATSWGVWPRSGKWTRRDVCQDFATLEPAERTG